MTMTSPLIYSFVSIGLFSIGLFALIFDPHVFRKILAFNVMGGGVFLLLIASAASAPEGAPDPVPHAMVLTGIVVSVSATAVGLALAKRYHHKTGRTSMPGEEDEE
ncbi:MAG: multicomponent Na+:H+ antiporter subunit C [Verrucomicrobiales bacterium]|jgi:multicomponent Na+:H+ antiporter subunit C